MAAGQYVAADPGLNKVVIVVDDDIDILDPAEVLRALGSRWQPTASLLIPQTQMTMPDPSRPPGASRARWSSMRPGNSRAKVARRAGRRPTTSCSSRGRRAFDLVDERWPEYMKNWKGLALGGVDPRPKRVSGSDGGEPPWAFSPSRRSIVLCGNLPGCATFCRSPMISGSR